MGIKASLLNLPSLYNNPKSIPAFFKHMPKKKQGRIHDNISRVLLGRGSNKAVYTSMSARFIITDRLQR